MATIPNVGELLLLTWALKSTTVPENLNLKLYTNNYTPVGGSIASNFTECAISGYAAKPISRGSWSTPTTVSGEAIASYPTQTFNFTASGTIWGYYVVGYTSNTLIFAEQFNSAILVASGDSLGINLIFGAGTYY
jgi:hypothetical protein